MRRALCALAMTAGLVARSPVARAAGAECGGQDDAAACPSNAYCAFPDGGAILDGGAGTCAVQSCGGGGSAQPCASSAYCALPDGGAILDGAAGACAVEPCVLSSDCANGEICDTSQNPFACVECISGSDCSGDQICDVTTHTCVEPPPPVDSGTLDGSPADGSSDASSPVDAAAPRDAAPPVDATVDAGGSGTDAAVPPSAEAGTTGAGGSLAGGACDCDLAAPRDAPLATMALPFGIALLFVSRRRSRRQPR